MSFKCGKCGQKFNNEKQAKCARCKPLQPSQPVPVQFKGVKDDRNGSATRHDQQR